MSKNIFIVESPLQLLNAYEAINFFQLDEYLIYIRYSNEIYNDSQLANLIDLLELSPNSIHKIYVSSINKTIFDYFKIIYYKIYFKLALFDKLFIGNAESKFLSIIYTQINKNKIIMLDDGTKTLSLQKKYTTHNYYNLFTMYHFQNIGQQEIFNNNYSGIKKIIDSKIDEDKILFLGSKLNEVHLISEEYYIELILNISHYYRHKNIIYVPHRGENREKLEKINQINNITIQFLDYPVELYGLYENTIPKTVASFYSTALLSLKKIYGVESKSFYFDFAESEYKDSIEEVYSLYKEEMEVVRLND